LTRIVKNQIVNLGNRTKPKSPNLCLGGEIMLKKSKTSASIEKRSSYVCISIIWWED